MGNGEVSLLFPVVWGCSCLYAVPAEQRKEREEELKYPQDSRGHESCSLLNIDWDSQTMAERNPCYPPVLVHPCLCKKKNPGLALRLGSCPSSALIHVLLLHCEPRSYLDCKPQEVVCALEHSDFVCPLWVNQTQERLPKDMTSWQQAAHSSSS